MVGLGHHVHLLLDLPVGPGLAVGKVASWSTVLLVYQIWSLLRSPGCPLAALLVLDPGHFLGQKSADDDDNPSSSATLHLCHIGAQEAGRSQN